MKKAADGITSGLFSVNTGSMYTDLVLVGMQLSMAAVVAIGEIVAEWVWGAGKDARSWWRGILLVLVVLTAGVGNAQAQGVPAQDKISAAEMAGWPDRDVCQWALQLNERGLSWLDDMYRFDYSRRGTDLTRAKSELNRAYRAWGYLNTALSGDSLEGDTWWWSLKQELTDEEWACKRMPAPIPVWALRTFP